LLKNIGYIKNKNGNVMKTRTEIFEMAIDGKPVKVKATPFKMHTEEQRYRVSINGSPVHIFAWDDQLNRLTIIDKAKLADNIPGNVEAIIGRQLYSRLAA
jgi:hypothetical protein